ncbi:cation transporter [Coprothermobacteraceae bacterium]|nr:cation transporter [Coprothermobacteraceae bacterium]
MDRNGHKDRHDHNHLTHKSSRRMRDMVFTLILNLLITAVELAGGVAAGSLSLISDALHNLSDAASLGVSMLALRLSQLPPDRKRTFGYRRASVIAALANTAVLAVICLELFKESYVRLLSPHPITGLTVVAIGAVGLLANTLGAYLLHRHSHDDLNVRSSYLHLASDALSSVAVVGGGLAIHYFKVFWIDPILTFFISAYVLKEAIDVLRATFNILLEGKPTDVSVDEVVKTLLSVRGVKGVHHVHLWTLDGNAKLLEAHVELDADLQVSETKQISDEVGEQLHKKFGIDHVTLQFEAQACGSVCPFQHF